MTDTEMNLVGDPETTKIDWGELADEDGVIREPRPFLRTHYNYDMHGASLQSGLQCFDETRTQQSFAEEVDINTIVRKFGLTGELPNNLKPPMTGDFTEVFDYQTSLNMVMAADDAFMQMPADIRERFGNDAGRWIEFVSDPANVDQCRKWGLAVAPEPAREPIDVRVIPGVQEAPKTAPAA